MPDRDAEFSLTARDHSGAATKSAADNFEKVGRSADKATRKIDELGDETGQLARKMAEAKVAAMALAREFDKTGDSKLLRDFEKVNREAAKLGKVFKTISLDPPKTSGGMFGEFFKTARQTGVTAGRLTMEGFAESFKALPGPVKTGILAGVVAGATLAAPFLSAVLQGAVLTGVAGGGIAGGLILGAKDPRVIEAYGILGTRINQKLQDGVARPFVEEMLRAAPKLNDAFDREEPRLRRIATNLASTLGPIVNNIIDAAHRLMPSLERAAATGGIILSAVARELPGLADSVGELFDAFSDNGPGAAVAMRMLVHETAAFISMAAEGAAISAPLLNLLGKMAELSGLAPMTNERVGVLSDTIVKSGNNAMMTSVQLQALNNALGNTADKANALNEAFDRLFNEEMGVQQANLAVNTGMLALTETIKNNKKTLDQHTEAGTQNAAVILQQVANLEAKRKADIAAGNGTAEATQAANAAYASQVAALRNLLIQMGFTAASVDALIGKLYAIPQTITTTITTVYRTKGTPPGYSDQLTGHSRTGSEDYSGLSGWRAAQFAAGQRAQLAAEPGGGAIQPPTEVHSELALTVELDGVPFRTMAARTTRAAEKRQAWRARVGARR